jgi:hypothetical protein
MKRLIAGIAIIFLFHHTLFAQDSTSVDDFSTTQTIALYTATGVLIPLAIAGTVISFLPPSFGVVMNEGVTYGSFNIEAGYGHGEKLETGEFTDYRVAATFTHIYYSRLRDLFRFEVKKDVHFDFIDRRKIFLKGMHFSAGLMSDFPNHGYSLGTGLWLKSPWLPFFGLFPSHTYGLTYRFNHYFQGKNFHELSLGMTSILTF